MVNFGIDNQSFDAKSIIGCLQPNPSIKKFLSVAKYKTLNSFKTNTKQKKVIISTCDRSKLAIYPSNKKPIET